MFVWRIAKKQLALDLTGIGARTYGGRWNVPGVAVIYAGMTPEISAMEKLVHAGDILPLDLVLVRLDLPDDASLYYRCFADNLPSGWDELPGSTVATEFGNAFITAGVHLGMIVPSAVMPEASNIVINPNHKTFANVEMSIIRPFEFDSRLRGK
jgi:RES domain-containing protein